MIVIHIVHIIYTSVPLARLHNFSLAFSLSICPFVVGNGMIVIRILWLNLTIWKSRTLRSSTSIPYGHMRTWLELFYPYQFTINHKIASERMPKKLNCILSCYDRCCGDFVFLFLNETELLCVLCSRNLELEQWTAWTVNTAAHTRTHE